MTTVNSNAMLNKNILKIYYNNMNKIIFNDKMSMREISKSYRNIKLHNQKVNWLDVLRKTTRQDVIEKHNKKYQAIEKKNIKKAMDNMKNEKKNIKKVMDNMKKNEKMLNKEEADEIVEFETIGKKKRITTRIKLRLKKWGNK